MKPFWGTELPPAAVTMLGCAPPHPRLANDVVEEHATVKNAGAQHKKVTSTTILRHLVADDPRNWSLPIAAATSSVLTAVGDVTRLSPQTISSDSLLQGATRFTGTAAKRRPCVK